MYDTLNIAIIGFGGISAFAHMPELLNETNIKVAGPCDLKTERAEVLKKRYRLDCDIYREYEGMEEDFRPVREGQQIMALSLYHYLFGEAELKTSAISESKYETSSVLTLAPKTDSDCTPAMSSIESGWGQADGIEMVTVMGSDGMICLTTTGRLII